MVAKTGDFVCACEHLVAMGFEKKDAEDILRALFETKITSEQLKTFVGTLWRVRGRRRYHRRRQRRGTHGRWCTCRRWHAAYRRTFPISLN